MNLPPFPPRNGKDVADYDLDEVVEGYRDRSDLEPGPNHSPAYRWGWQNRKRDHMGGVDDGYDHIRRDYSRIQKMH